MKTSKFEVYRDIAGYYRWRLKARNGEIVSISESYDSKYNALESAEKMKIWSWEAIIVEL
jgi:uncharacterized protein YegP (UPF0339 family)